MFEFIGETPQAKKCAAMEDLVKEGEGVIEKTEDGSMIRDVGINVSAKKVENYEITAYGSLRQLAITMGQDGTAGWESIKPLSFLLMFTFIPLNIKKRIRIPDDKKRKCDLNSLERTLWIRRRTFKCYKLSGLIRSQRHPDSI